MTKTRKNRNTNNKTKKIFTKKEYNSGDGMLTTAWGPAIWHYLHMMSFNYPVKPTSEDKKHYRDFVVNLQYVLPCKYCRINLKNNFKQKPLKMCDMASRETFSRYIYLPILSAKFRSIYIYMLIYFYKKLIYIHS